MQVRSHLRPFIRTPRLAGLAAAALLAAALAGCASSSAPARDWTQQLQRWSDAPIVLLGEQHDADRKSTRLNSSHLVISYAVFCLKKKKIIFIYFSPHQIHAVLAMCIRNPV